MRCFYVILFLGSFFFFPFKIFSASIDFLVSEELLPKEEELNTILDHPSLKNLMELKNIKRPTKCPIKNLTGDDLVSKLHLISGAFEQGECLNSNRKLLKQFSAMAEKASSTYSAMKNPEGSYDDLSSLSSISDITDETQVDTALESLEATEENLADTEYYSNAMNYLSQISEDENCVSNLRKGNFLSTVGNVLTTMGQTSLMVPSSSGFLFSAAGIGLGTTLKILGSLFKSPFNWDTRKERKQFQDLNCSFYDLRTEIEAARIFGINEKVSAERIGEIKRQILALEAYSKKMLAEQSSVNLKVQEKKKNYYAAHDLIHKFHLNESITVFLSKFSLELGKEAPNQGLIVRMVSEFAQKIQGMEAVETLKNYPVIKKIFDAFSLDSVMDSHGLDYKILHRKFLNPLEVYLKDNKEALDRELLTPTKDFLDLRTSPESKSNKELIQLVNKAYLGMMKKAADIKVYLNNQIIILSNHNNQKELDAYDDGGHKHYDVLEEYFKIQDFIYHSFGYPYIKHFRKNAYEHEKKFRKKVKKLDLYKRVIPKEKELPWVCRTAKQTVATWDYADDSIEVIWDFLETNKALFYQDVHRVKLMMGFFPIGRTKEYKLYKAARSAEISKNVYFKNPSYDRSELDDYGIWSKHNVGKLILKIKESKKQKEEIVSYMKENKCSRFTL